MANKTRQFIYRYDLKRHDEFLANGIGNNVIDYINEWGTSNSAPAYADTNSIMYIKGIDRDHPEIQVVLANQNLDDYAAGDTIILSTSGNTDQGITERPGGILTFVIPKDTTTADPWEWKVKLTNIPAGLWKYFAEGSAKIHFPLNLPRGTQTEDVIDYTTLTPLSGVTINSKTVKAINIGGTEITDLAIDGHPYSFSKDITITQQEVAGFVTAHTTWAAAIIPTATYVIDDTDYTLIGALPGSQPNNVALTAWTTAPTSKVVLKDGETVSLKFKTDITIPGDKGIVQFLAIQDSRFGYYFTSTFASQEFKAGDTWIFENNKDPIKVVQGQVATVDTTAKLKGLTVEYSKSTGIADSEQITATVKYDASVASTLNGGTTDMVVPGIYIVNPDRTITEKQVTDYADAHIAWPEPFNPTYTIPASSFGTTVSDPSHNYIVTLSYWHSAPTSKITLVDGESILLDVTGDFTITPNANKEIIIMLTANPQRSYSLHTNSIVTLAPKKGEQWLFAEGKDPVLYDPNAPTVTSANLDVSKWGTEVDIASTLYTPDLHMVDGKEITLTVQPVDGFTVNGGAKFDVQYTPSSTPPFAGMIVPEDSYSRASVYSSSTGYYYIYDTLANFPADWATGNGSFSPGTDGFRMWFKIAWKHTTTSSSTQIGVVYGGHDSMWWDAPSPMTIDIKAGETWDFFDGKAPVKVSDA